MNDLNRLKEYDKYHIKVDVNKGKYVVMIKFDKDWSIVESDNEDIKILKDKENKNIIYYISDISTDLNEIFDSIDETINYNREISLKVELIQKKIAELQELFVQESYDKLLNLKFVFDDDKPVVKEVKKRAKKTTKSKKEEPKVEEKVESTNNIDKLVEKAVNGGKND